MTPVDERPAARGRPRRGRARPAGRGRRRWVRRSLLGLLALVGLVVVVVGATAVRVWQVAREDARPQSDVILVLGASQFDGRPSEVFAARLAHAKSLYDEQVSSRIVTLGGSQRGDRFTEAVAGARWLHDRGVPDGALIPVGEGNDTLQSLQAAGRVLRQRGWESAVIVTDPWHSLRARRMARDQHIRAETSPARTGPAVHTRSTEIRYIARETVAYLYYRVFHSDSTHSPGAV